MAWIRLRIFSYLCYKNFLLTSKSHFTILLRLALVIAGSVVQKMINNSDYSKGFDGEGSYQILAGFAFMLLLNMTMGRTLAINLLRDR